MKNDSPKISANEINKFIYCPYQWYYQRLYGNSKIRKMYNEKMLKLGLSDTSTSNLKKGVKFHNSYYLKNKIKTILKTILLFVSILIILAVVYYLRKWI